MPPAIPGRFKGIEIQTKRDVFINALVDARREAFRDFPNVAKSHDQRKKVRSVEVYFEALKKAEQAGMTGQSARNFANNELARAGLPRMEMIQPRRYSTRDRVVQEMEDQLRERLKTDKDREYERLMEEQNAKNAKVIKKGRTTKVV